MQSFKREYEIPTNVDGKLNGSSPIFYGRNGLTITSLVREEQLPYVVLFLRETYDVRSVSYDPYGDMCVLLVQLGSDGEKLSSGLEAKNSENGKLVKTDMPDVGPTLCAHQTHSPLRPPRHTQGIMCGVLQSTGTFCQWDAGTCNMHVCRKCGAQQVLNSLTHCQ